jgi:hypothetical protein
MRDAGVMGTLSNYSDLLIFASILNWNSSKLSLLVQILREYRRMYKISVFAERHATGQTHNRKTWTGSAPDRTVRKTEAARRRGWLPLSRCWDDAVRLRIPCKVKRSPV